MVQQHCKLQPESRQNQGGIQFGVRISGGRLGGETRTTVVFGLGTERHRLVAGLEPKTWQFRARTLTSPIGTRPGQHNARVEDDPHEVRFRRREQSLFCTPETMSKNC